MEYPEFKGKTSIATGAASGMALLFLQKMAEQGANVVLTDVNEDAVQAAAGEIRRKGGSAVGVKVDVRKYEEIRNAADIAMEKFGRIDYLMNSAGGCSQRVCKQSGGFVNASPESIEWGVDVNLKGAVLFVRAVLGRMFEQNYGVIINMEPGNCELWRGTRRAFRLYFSRSRSDTRGDGEHADASRPGGGTGGDCEPDPVRLFGQRFVYYRMQLPD